MIVHLIRHGQALNTHPEEGFANPENPPLTPQGVAQAECIARRLASLPIDRLMTSPMRRSIETALPIARALGRPAEIWFRSHEFRGASGYTAWGANEIRTRFPQVMLPHDFADEGWYYGNERLDLATARADALIDWLSIQNRKSPLRQVAIVSHGDFIRIVIARILGLHVHAFWPLTLSHTSICTARFLPDDSSPPEAAARARNSIEILSINDVDHLGDDSELDPMARLSR